MAFHDLTDNQRRLVITLVERLESGSYRAEVTAIHLSEGWRLLLRGVDGAASDLTDGFGETDLLALSSEGYITLIPRRHGYTIALKPKAHEQCKLHKQPHDLQAVEAERRASLQQQLALQRANLNELELQRARFGIRVPLDLINEIKLVQQRIEEVEQELALLGSGERSPRVAAEEPGRGERTESARIDSGGGAVIFGDVHVGRDFVGRDGNILSDVHDDEDNGNE